ncbi:hypothetical protein WNY61_03315 [Sulfitobacter sp. AS92]|uniref:hypothetical protein n=1 Tax=Sulfitobacter sp. AS92 TaxID=3135783 RepID=UPI0031740212
MSLCRFALRHTAVEALRGQTLVGDNVKNSDFRALDIAADGALRDNSDKPFILIYTDDATVGGMGHPTLWENGIVELVIESGIAAAMGSFDEETGETTFTGYGVPATDTGMEAALDIIDRQVAMTLHGDGEWALLFAHLHDGITKIERKRATLSDSGTRLAARQIRMWVDAKADPAWGAELAPAHYAKRFEAAVAGTDVEANVAALLGPADAPMSYEQVRARYGLSGDVASALVPAALYPGGAPVSEIRWLVE